MKFTTYTWASYLVPIENKQVTGTEGMATRLQNRVTRFNPPNKVDQGVAEDIPWPARVGTQPTMGIG